MTLAPALVDAILDRLGVARPIAVDLDGLARLYAGWCQAVPFDNVQKLAHLGGGGGSPLPGSTATDFFTAWLATGAGGTCWAGNGALHDLLAALAFPVKRVAATMLSAPDAPPSNHGSVLVELATGRYLVDASVLAGVPLALAAPAGVRVPPTMPRVERYGATYAIIWRTLRAPDGFPCRIDRIGIDADEWFALHQHTARWSPFNFAVSARVNRGARAIGYGLGQRYEFDAAGALAATPVDRAARDRFLVEELGIAAALVARLPADREVAPAPADHPRVLPPQPRSPVFSSRHAPLALPRDVETRLAVAYGEPHRAYHTAAHIAAVLRCYDAITERDGWRQPAEVYLAILFHDVVYDSLRADNEARSAALAEEVARRIGGVDAARVGDLIRLTARHGSLELADVADDVDAARFLDCDVSILAAPPDEFAAYDRGVAIEYESVPRAAYRAGRRAFLQQVLGRPRIFFSSEMHAELDGRARANIARALDALRSEESPAPPRS